MEAAPACRPTNSPKSTAPITRPKTIPNCQCVSARPRGLHCAGNNARKVLKEQQPALTCDSVPCKHTSIHDSQKSRTCIHQSRSQVTSMQLCVT
jgi:hypothetical protein